MAILNMTVLEFVHLFINLGMLKCPMIFKLGMMIPDTVWYYVESVVTR